MTFKDIPNIGNVYGGLWIAEHEGKYYWIIDGYGGGSCLDITQYTEISKDLYDAIKKEFFSN